MPFFTLPRASKREHTTIHLHTVEATIVLYYATKKYIERN